MGSSSITLEDELKPSFFLDDDEGVSYRPVDDSAPLDMSEQRFAATALKSEIKALAEPSSISFMRHTALNAPSLQPVIVKSLCTRNSLFGASVQLVLNAV